MFHLVVNRKNFQEYKISKIYFDSEKTLKEGQILMKIDRFAFTANNITYATVGDLVGYWNFFSISLDWGIIPVWGYAVVVNSNNKQIEVGTRYYGFYPMGSHLVLEPKKIDFNTFIDGTAHRQGLPIIYNNYTKANSSFSKLEEANECIFKPLFTTSFLIDDFLNDNQFFKSHNIILLSASSKTALCLGSLLKKRRKEYAIKIIGITSSKNRSFVECVGYYDQVLEYGQIDKIPKEQPTVIVDFSGSELNQEKIQIHLGNQLKYNCLVGIVDWSNACVGHGYSSNGTFFFAPTQAEKKNKNWGVVVFQQKLKTTWLEFIQKTNSWLTIEEHSGESELASLYPKILNGEMRPNIGYIVSL